MTKSKGDRLMTLAELASYLHMGKKTVLELAAAKKLPGTLLGNEWRFKRETIDAWLDQMASGDDDSFEQVPDAAGVPLGDLLPDESIVHEMRARDALGAIEELAARAYQNLWLYDKPWFIGALVERETLASTAMEGGVAFLHTRSREASKIARPFVIVGRSHGGIEFGAPDGRPTHLFFLLGLKYDRLHLPILGRLARLMMRNPKSVARLRSTTSPTKMRDTLLRLDAEELSSRPGQAVDFGEAEVEPEPKLDREVRLRAIKRLNATRRQGASGSTKAKGPAGSRKAKSSSASSKKAKSAAASKKKSAAASKKKSAAASKKKSASSKSSSSKKTTGRKSPRR